MTTAHGLDPTLTASCLVNTFGCVQLASKCTGPSGTSSTVQCPCTYFARHAGWVARAFEGPFSFESLTFARTEMQTESACGPLVALESRSILSPSVPIHCTPAPPHQNGSLRFGSLAWKQTTGLSGITTFAALPLPFRGRKIVGWVVGYPHVTIILSHPYDDASSRTPHPC